MFDSTIFDVAFGLVCVFLAISLLTSALTEAVSTVFGLRANTLLSGIKQLLNDPDFKGLAFGLYNHALFNPLSDGKTDPGGTPSVKPSYVDPRHFALAFISTLQATADEKATLLDAINKIQDKQIKTTLLTLHQRAKGEINGFGALLAGWFDEAMTRLSGVYKRWLKLISFFIAFAVAVLLNADPIHLADTLWERQPVAAQLAKITMPNAKDGGSPGSEALTILREVEGAGPLLGWSSFANDRRSQGRSETVLMLLPAA
jgi:hypothetical protein